jgi:uncharacterized membrane protein
MTILLMVCAPFQRQILQIVEGIRQTGTLYMFITAILLISAIYGVIEWPG